jgi:O-antigen/teichoic acid export membrane protein
MGKESFGSVLLLFGICQIIMTTSGTSLNNTRLLMETEYQKKGVIGDFNLLLICITALSVLIIPVSYILLDSKVFVIQILILAVLVAFGIANEYLVVQYRLQLNYTRILLYSTYLSLGYILGLLLFKITKEWLLVLLLGYVVSFIYNYRNTTLLREPFVKTVLSKATNIKFINLLGASGLSSALLYLDRIILFPLVGGERVSIYYSASVVGKLIASIIGPLASILLSYIVRVERLTTRAFLVFNGILLIVGFIGYWICVFISGPLINILYSDWAVESMTLILYTNAIAVLGIYSTMLNPILLRFTKSYYQVIIQICYIALYLGCSLLLLGKYGLRGFAIGILIASVGKIALMLIIGYAVLAKQNSGQQKSQTN